MDGTVVNAGGVEIANVIARRCTSAEAISSLKQEIASAKTKSASQHLHRTQVQV